MEEIRLGDVIDDYCSRCQLLSNHSVVAMIGPEVKRVRCRTCNHEHNFRHGKLGRKRAKEPSAFEQLVATMGPPPNVPPPPTPKKSGGRSRPLR